MTKSGPLGTTQIGIRPATNAFHAARYAAETNRLPTVAVTINWDRLGYDDEHASAMFRDLRRRVRRRWKYLRLFDPSIGHLDDFGSHENPDGRRNTHWSVYVPTQMTTEFRSAVEKAARAVTKLRVLPNRAILFQRIEAVGSHMKYLLKGIRPDAASYFHMEAIPQGFVSGRGRTFVSRSLGFSARKAANWKRKRRPRTT